MKKSIAVLTFVCITFFANAQVKYLSLGYTSTSERNVDLEYFGDHALTVNSGAPLSFVQPRKGFNIGFGVESAAIEDGVNFYLRTGLNYSRYGGKVFSNGPQIKSAANAFDANLGIGFGPGMGGGNSMLALYALVGGSHIREQLTFASEYGLQAKYKASRTNISYGLGLGIITTNGFALALDCLIAIPPAQDKHAFENDDVKLASDYDTYHASPTAYNGGYVYANWKWIRAEVKLLFPLGGD